VGGAASWGVLLRDVVEIRMEISKREQEYVKPSSRLQNEIGYFYMCIVSAPSYITTKSFLCNLCTILHGSTSRLGITIAAKPNELG
jgi:hypothetical protein